MHVSTDINPGGYIFSRSQGGGSAVKSETQIQNAIRVALSEIGIVRRNNVGTYLTPYGKPIVIGIPGEPDLTLFTKTGETIFIEIKTPAGRQSAKQKHFQKVVESYGFRYMIMRSVSDAEKFVSSKLKAVE